jgi:hypothetical protein
MPHDLTGWLRPRPTRIAFLIEDGEHSSLALDGIFADCYGRWGGRFSLIVPCIDGQIAQSYWPWLENYDPDIVYSYVPLAKVAILELHERLSPAQYHYHRMNEHTPRLDMFGFKPHYDFQPLSSLSIIFRMARFSPSRSGGAPVRIIDCWHTESPSRFLTDNFGTYHASSGSGMFPTDATTAASLLTIVDPEKRASRRFGVPQDLTTIPNELAAFEEYAEGRAISLSLASTLFAPKLDIRSNNWSSSFNLVVGGSFADRIMFWNARLLIPAWLDTDLCCLRVDLEQLDEPAFLKVLDTLIKRRNHVNSGSGGQPQLTIRSASLDTKKLEDARTLLGSTKPRSFLAIHHLTELGEIVPTSQAFQQAREGNRFGGGFSVPPDWTQFVWSPPTARPLASVPDHLSDAPPRQLFTQGYWCTDFTFEYDGTGPRFAQENQWELPRRWRMAGAFKTSLIGESSLGLLPPPRRSRGGRLAIFVSADHPIEAVKIPTAGEAIRHALAADGLWQDPNAEHDRIRPPSKVLWSRPSNEARYLTGVLGLTGGLQRAAYFLLHPFLRDTFARFGGTPNLPTDKVAPTVSRLRKRVPRVATFDLHSEREREALGILIAKAAQALKKPLDYIGYDDLKAGWKAHRAAYWEAHPQPQQPDSDVDWDELEEQSLDSCLIEMRRRQVLFQGHQWTCRQCHHRNWIDLAALSADLSCQVCKRPTQAPVDIRWLFRPNEFLIDSLSNHSVLSLVWLLTKLCERARRSFVFEGPTWFGYTREETPQAEIDLLAVIDGRTVLCEAKSSWSRVRSSDITNLVALATRLRPDVALLGVMESGGGPTNDLQAAQTQLAAYGIEFEVLTLNDANNLQDGPYLHFD